MEQQSGQPVKRSKKMLVYRIVLILLILALLIYSIAVFLTRQSSALLSQEGSWVATYETGLLDISLDTNGNQATPVAVKLLGGTKFSENPVSGDPEFNSMVLPVTIRLANTGTVDLRAKITLSMPAIGKTDLDSGEGKDNGILYMVLPKGIALEKGADYRKFLVDNLPGIDTSSSYADLKQALTLYNAEQVESYTKKQAELVADSENPENTMDINLLFWASYNELLEYNQADGFLSNASVLPSWYNFVVHVNTTQIEAPESALESEKAGESY